MLERDVEELYTLLPATPLSREQLAAVLEAKVPASNTQADRLLRELLQPVSHLLGTAGCLAAPASCARCILKASVCGLAHACQLRSPQ